MSFNFVNIGLIRNLNNQEIYISSICIYVEVAMHECVKECDVVDAKKEVVFVSITSTKTYEVGESFICERKSSDRYIAMLVPCGCFVR